MEKATARVAVLYASDYGFSDRLSQTLARGITKAGVAVEMLDTLSADPQARQLSCLEVFVCVSSALLYGTTSGCARTVRPWP